MISECYITDIDPSICDPNEVSRFYFLYNLLGLTDEIDSRYIDHEYKQVNVRNRIISDAIKNGMIPKRPNVNSTILGLSSLRDSAILVVDY